LTTSWPIRNPERTKKISTPKEPKIPKISRSLSK